MLKSKKLNGSMIAVVVLSVLLVLAITTGGTLAWFASRATAQNYLTLGDNVIINVGSTREGSFESSGKLDLVTPAGLLVPGMIVRPNFTAEVENTTTPSIVRAKFNVNVTFPSAVNVKVSNAEEDGTIDLNIQTLLEKALNEELDRVLTGGVKRQLERDAQGGLVVELKDGKEVGSTDVEDYELKYATIDPSNYVRRVSTGWYRDLETTSVDLNQGIPTEDYTPLSQENYGWWYFVGNGTDVNGYSKAFSVDAETSVATYSDDGVTNPEYNTSGEDTIYSVTATPATSTLLTGGKVASVVFTDPEGEEEYHTGNALIPFLVRDFMLPTFLTNEFANAKVTFQLEVQALQDYLIVDENPTSDTFGVRQEPTLALVRRLFAAALTDFVFPVLP